MQIKSPFSLRDIFNEALSALIFHFHFVLSKEKTWGEILLLEHKNISTLRIIGGPKGFGNQRTNMHVY